MIIPRAGPWIQICLTLESKVLKPLALRRKKTKKTLRKLEHRGCENEGAEDKTRKTVGTGNKDSGSLGKVVYYFHCEHEEKACSMVLRAPLNVNGEGVLEKWVKGIYVDPNDTSNPFSFPLEFYRTLQSKRDQAENSVNIFPPGTWHFHIGLGRLLNAKASGYGWFCFPGSFVDHSACSW